jgi:hypothetical protein
MVMMKLTNMDWQEDAREMCARLTEMCAQAGRPISDRAICFGAAELLKQLVEELEARVGTAPAQDPAEGGAPKSKPANRHRHVYDEGGWCKLAMEDGSGLCGAMSREAKRAAAAPAPAAPAGS